MGVTVRSQEFWKFSARSHEHFQFSPRRRGWTRSRWSCAWPRRRFSSAARWSGRGSWWAGNNPDSWRIWKKCDQDQAYKKSNRKWLTFWIFLASDLKLNGLHLRETTTLASWSHWFKSPLPHMQIRTTLDSARLPKGLIISQTKKNEILIEKGLYKIRSENIKSD